MRRALALPLNRCPVYQSCGRASTFASRHEDHLPEGGTPGKFKGRLNNPDTADMTAYSGFP